MTVLPLPPLILVLMTAASVLIVIGVLVSLRAHQQRRVIGEDRFGRRVHTAALFGLAAMLTAGLEALALVVHLIRVWVS